MLKREALLGQASLRSDDAAQGVAARKHNAAMIDLRRLTCGLCGSWQAGTLDQGSATSRTPVGNRVGCKFSMAVAANAFHICKITRSVQFSSVSC